jgi:hypothetical protein
MLPFRRPRRMRQTRQLIAQQDTWLNNFVKDNLKKLACQFFICGGPCYLASAIEHAPKGRLCENMLLILVPMPPRLL